jgi:hypothetical protein
MEVPVGQKNYAYFVVNHVDLLVPSLCSIVLELWERKYIQCNTCTRRLFLTSRRVLAILEETETRRIATESLKAISES